MIGLSLTSTVAQRDATIATLRAELSAANATVSAMGNGWNETRRVAADLSEQYYALVAKLADFADRSIPPKVSGAKVQQPKSTPDADLAVVARERERAKRTPV